MLLLLLLLLLNTLLTIYIYIYIIVGADEARLLHFILFFTVLSQLMCLKPWFQHYPRRVMSCCCSSVLRQVCFCASLKNRILRFFFNPPKGTAPRPELLFDVLVAHFSKKPCCPTIGFQTNWAPYARVSVAMRYLRDCFFRSFQSSGIAINFM